MVYRTLYILLHCLSCTAIRVTGGSLAVYKASKVGRNTPWKNIHEKIDPPKGPAKYIQRNLALSVLPSNTHPPILTLKLSNSFYPTPTAGFKTPPLPDANYLPVNKMHAKYMAVWNISFVYFILILLYLRPLVELDLNK